jgi:hypothetical protein
LSCVTVAFSEWHSPTQCYQQHHLIFTINTASRSPKVCLQPVQQYNKFTTIGSLSSAVFTANRTPYGLSKCWHAS